MWFQHTTLSPKDVEGMANCEDHDQTAPVGAQTAPEQSDLGLYYLLMLIYSKT